MTVAPQRDHRYAHPHGFARGCRAVVGKAIEADVDPVIEVEMAAAFLDRGDQFLAREFGEGLRQEEDCSQPRGG